MVDRLQTGPERAGPVLRLPSIVINAIEGHLLPPDLRGAIISGVISGAHRVFRLVSTRARRRLVDSTYGDIKAPATSKPCYEVAPGAQLVPVNALAQIKEPWQRYVIVGAGKTAMDAVVFLINQGMEPDRIQWIIPNDAWFFNRASIQPGVFMRTFLDYFRCIAESSTVDEVFKPLWHPSHTQDFVSLVSRAFHNQMNANRHMGRWMRRSRLNAFHYDPLPRFILDSWKLQRIGPDVADSVEKMVGAEPA